MLRKVWIAWLVGAVCGIAVGWKHTPETRLDFLSVGQGDCTVFQTNGNVVLIDAGPRSETFDAGKKIVLPDLDKIGATGVDLIFLTHPDVDHMGGIGALHKAFPSAKIVISDQFRSNEAMQRHLKAARVEESDVEWLGPTANIKVGDFSLTIRDPAVTTDTEDNEGSMFIHLVGPSASAVFSGDAGAKTEQAMEPLLDWGSQVLKVGHHGSKSSTAESWLKEVHPTYAVISCGLNNRYGHPARQTLTRLANAKTIVFRTDFQSDVTFAYDAQRGFYPKD